MIFKRRVGPKGQVVIPRDVREKFGISEGSEVLFEARDDEVVLRTSDDSDEWVERFASVVKKKLRSRVDVKAIMEEESELALR